MKLPARISSLDVQAHEIAALILITAAALFHVFVGRPAEERLSSLEQALNQYAASSQPQPPNENVRNTAEKLAAFHAFFDRKVTYSEWLARFYAIAAKSGIDTRRAEYRRIAHASAPLVLYEVALPVSGEYTKVRAFAEAVLTAIPVVSLDRITMSRKQAGESIIEADLKFTFYVPAGAAR